MKRQAYAFFICATEHLFEATYLVAKHLNVHEASAVQRVVVCRNRPGLIDQMWLAGLPLEMENAVHEGIIPLEVITALPDVMSRKHAYRLSRMYGEGIFFEEVNSFMKTHLSSRRRARSRFTKNLKKQVTDLSFLEP